MSLRVRNGHERLYLMRPDGTHQRPLDSHFDAS
jgi:hypothetical protein